MKTWQIISTIISIILGTLLHFTYQLSGENKIVAVFSAVNESTWEHLKLAFWGIIIMAIIGKFVVKKQISNYWTAQVAGILTAISFITIFFYTYTGILGKNFGIFNIILFIIAMILGGYVIYKIMDNPKDLKAEGISILFIIIVLFSFILYTFSPPEIAYFKDPIDGTYGVGK